jgi:hypothetical protein
VSAPAVQTLDSPPLVRYGLPEYRLGDAPAAAAHFVQAVEGAFFVRLVSLHVRLVTDANAANRTVLVEYRDDADRRYDLSGAPVTQPASTTTDWIFSAFQAQAEWEIDGTVLVPLHPVLLLPTHDFRVFVDNVQAGDQLSLVRFVWERFYTTSQPSQAVPLP